ncbi:MAG: hypothetical protein JSS28_12990, partial [Proteobacteria bacterium]|nr:hypothetical protein [Pseudomonadota bacterium]
ASANTTSPLPGGTSSNPPPPPFGANTIDFEIDLASLPTTVNLCNSSTESSYYDFMWTVGANYDATFAAPLTLFAAHTPLESGCSSPTSAALLTSVSGALYKLDPNNIQNGYTLVESLPATVDTTNGKIVIQADRTDPNLTGFASGQLIESTFENMIVSNGAQEISPSAFSTAYPSDPSTPLFDFGSSVVDPNGDVCTSSSLSSCTSTAYPLIDIIGGSAHMDDYIFRNSFE